ncbi:hypothetical protein HPB47_017658 [Ixodes persulcatus]|uniref:Uncharacterized protein n=1 Tax=Ixodes persulcatus TaxID=34615 RepID=A0AC60QMR9_IXOPE|nr:hypothetical protein HPB47_017658 [Ixodes persulcatus]
MATGFRTAERLSKNTCTSTSMHHPAMPPAFVTYNTACFSDVMQLLEYIPQTVGTLILHVGTDGLAKDVAQASLERLREIKRIYLSLVLPRSVNRRLRFSNHRFVRWFNGQVSTFNIEASKLCSRRASGTFYNRHACSEMPALRVLAADGLHPSFEGVALLALHLQNIIMQNKEQGPTGWSDTPRATRTPESAGSGSPASPTQRVLALSRPTRCPRIRSRPQQAPDGGAPLRRRREALTSCGAPFVPFPMLSAAVPRSRSDSTQKKVL